MRKLLFVLLLLLSCSQVNGQLLWKVSGNGCYETSYLFGTLHLETSEFIDSVPGLATAIENVDVIFGEIEGDNLTSMNTVLQMMKDATAPADSTIDKLLSPEDYKMVDAVVKKYMFGFGLKELGVLKPAVLTAQLDVMQMQKLYPNSLDPNNLIDVAIQNRGKQLGKRVDGLESVEDQTSALFGAPLKEQAEDLVDFCRKDGEFAESNKQLHDAYRAQDLAAIEKIVFDSEMGMDDADMDRLSYERNRKWMDKITQTLPVQRVLVAVGAAHLVGEQGLIELLRSQGYVVEAFGSK
ncbi:MAG: TraB/GumN family protein [Muribaculaceae bacterium]|nr:TraB/GumN family protein [Muribaculaceae bacterium]